MYTWLELKAKVAYIAHSYIIQFGVTSELLLALR